MRYKADIRDLIRFLDEIDNSHWEEFEICGAYEGKVNFLKFGKKLFFCRLLPTRPLQVCKIFMFV